MSTWFITGCSSGLGRAIATRALQRGHSVCVTARNPGTLADLVALAPDRCIAAACDVTSDASVRSAVQACLDRFGGIDVLLSNAGYAIIGGIEEFSDEQIRTNIDTNLMGPIRLLRAALPSMRAARKGHIMLISAIAALANHEGFSIYGGAKAGLEGLAEALALDLKPTGIRTTLVLPGPTRTDFIARSLQPAATTIDDYAPTAGKFAKFLSTISGKQTGDPVKIADLIIDVTESDTPPPLRLITGKYAITRARAKFRTAAAELDTWEPRTAPTDF